MHSINLSVEPSSQLMSFSLFKTNLWERKMQDSVSKLDSWDNLIASLLGKQKLKGFRLWKSSMELWLSLSLSFAVLPSSPNMNICTKYRQSASIYKEYNILIRMKNKRISISFVKGISMCLISRMFDRLVSKKSRSVFKKVSEGEPPKKNRFCFASV